MTVRLRLHATQMVSKGLAQISRLMTRPHRRVKYPIFLLLENDEVADLLERIAHCVWPSWCLVLRAKHWLRTQECKRILLLAALRIRTDAVPAELGHAFVRRWHN